MRMRSEPRSRGLRGPGNIIDFTSPCNPGVRRLSSMHPYQGVGACSVQMPCAPFCQLPRHRSCVLPAPCAEEDAATQEELVRFIKAFLSNIDRRLYWSPSREPSEGSVCMRVLQRQRLAWSTLASASGLMLLQVFRQYLHCHRIFWADPMRCM